MRGRPGGWSRRRRGRSTGSRWGSGIRNDSFGGGGRWLRRTDKRKTHERTDFGERLRRRRRRRKR